MRQGSRFNLEDVISHLPGRDASLSQVYASDGVPVQAKAYRRLIILQSQLHSVNGRDASGDLTIRPLSSTSEDLGMKTVLVAATCAETAPPSSTR